LQQPWLPDGLAGFSSAARTTDRPLAPPGHALDIQLIRLHRMQARKTAVNTGRNMKLSNISLLISLLLTLNSSGQQHMGKHIDITLSNAGTSTWPIKLTKEWLEGDTIYVFTFRDVRCNTTGKTSSQGFYKFELKEFGHALDMALAIDSTQEVRFSNGTMNLGKATHGMKYIECTFSSRTGTFRARDGDVKKLIRVINKQ
jgi:hypothetical protein